MKGRIVQVPNCSAVRTVLPHCTSSRPSPQLLAFNRTLLRDRCPIVRRLNRGQITSLHRPRIAVQMHPHFCFYQAISRANLGSADFEPPLNRACRSLCHFGSQVSCSLPFDRSGGFGLSGGCDVSEFHQYQTPSSRRWPISHGDSICGDQSALLSQFASASRWLSDTYVQ